MPIQRTCTYSSIALIHRNIDWHTCTLRKISYSFFFSVYDNLFVIWVRNHQPFLPLTLHSIDTHFNTSTTDSFWKHCGKRRNCSSRAISSFPTMFSTQSEICIPICQYFWYHIFICSWTGRAQKCHVRWRVNVLILQNSLNLKVTQTLSSANQKLCNFQLQRAVENKTTNAPKEFLVNTDLL